MEVTIIIALFCGTCFALPYQQSHTIPIEGYATKLENLGEHLEIPETPVKVIKITKTIAIKVPVPYPVRVVEKVPYPVNVNKPYPVPVPHIVKVPHVPTAATESPHEPIDIKHRSISFQNLHEVKLNDAQYQIQEEQGDEGDVPKGNLRTSHQNHQPFMDHYHRSNQQYGAFSDYPSEDSSEPFGSSVSNIDEGDGFSHQYYDQKLTSHLPNQYSSLQHNDEGGNYYHH